MSSEGEAEGRPIPSQARDVPSRSTPTSGSVNMSFMEHLAAAGAIGSFRGREHSMLEPRPSLGRRPSTDGATVGSISRSESMAEDVRHNPKVTPVLKSTAIAYRCRCTKVSLADVQRLHSVADMDPFNNEAQLHPAAAGPAEDVAILPIAEPSHSLRGRHTRTSETFPSTCRPSIEVCPSAGFRFPSAITYAQPCAANRA